MVGQHGGDVQAADNTGQTALHWSAVRGHVAVAELLLKEGARVDAADLYGYQVCFRALLSVPLLMPSLLLDLFSSVSSDKLLHALFLVETILISLYLVQLL